jgi:hypothetical protein
MVTDWFPRAVHVLKRRRHQGQVLILTAIGMTVLLGFVAVSVDVGYAMTERRQVQTAVDSAAIAAANAALANASDAVVISTAKVYGADNAGVSTDDVDVQRPPTSGDHAGDKNYIQVSIHKDVPRFFTSAVYHGDWSVSASAMSAIIPSGSDAAILALNDHTGGIETHGSSTIKVTGDGASIVSNYNINTNGSTIISATGWVTAHQGFSKHGSTTITGGLGTNESAAVMPDPLKDKIDPPVLPAFPTNPIANVNPTAGQCNNAARPQYYPPPTSGDYSANPGTYSGSSCTFNISGSTAGGNVFTFNYGSYKFKSGAQITTNFNEVDLNGGTYIFDGSTSGISIGGSTPNFIMSKGKYAFLNGAQLSIGGSAPNNVICKGALTYNDCTVYFSGGGGIVTGGSNNLTLYPGTYIFDGGAGLNMSGSANLTFKPGTYQFYFNSGADLAFQGSSSIKLNGTPYAQMWFYGNDSAKTTDQCPGGPNSSDLCLQGSTNFSIPSGEYYFEDGRVLAQGSSKIAGSDIFLYFKGKSYLYSSGSAAFGFTAPTDEIYPGYYPGVFIYSDATNNSQFTWTGSTSSVSQGIVYIPSAKLVMTGSSSSKMMVGQIIADSFDLSGSNGTSVEYHQYVETSIPRAFLVQ